MTTINDLLRAAVHNPSLLRVLPDAPPAEKPRRTHPPKRGPDKRRRRVRERKGR